MVWGNSYHVMVLSEVLLVCGPEYEETGHFILTVVNTMGWILLLPPQRHTNKERDTQTYAQRDVFCECFCFSLDQFYSAPDSPSFSAYVHHHILQITALGLLVMHAFHNINFSIISSIYVLQITVWSKNLPVNESMYQLQKHWHICYSSHLHLKKKFSSLSIAFFSINLAHFHMYCVHSLIEL